MCADLVPPVPAAATSRPVRVTGRATRDAPRPRLSRRARSSRRTHDRGVERRAAEWGGHLTRSDQGPTMNVPSLRTSIPAFASALGLCLAAVIAPSPQAEGATMWTPVPLAHLQVTSGAITTLWSSLLQTRSPQMRAVEHDAGRHAQWARLKFRYRQPSDGTSPLRSGAIRRQIGLKLLAGDPCNLVYVMWWEYPVHEIAISVKRNPGQTTSSQCGNRGYTEITKIPLPTPRSVHDHRKHVLEARTRREPDGTLALTVLTDRTPVYDAPLPTNLTTDLNGPIGARSDNGRYTFTLDAGHRQSR